MDRRQELKEQYRVMKPTMGIVIFECLPSGKAYLACARDTKAVINSKRFQLESGRCFCMNMQSDWEEYGAKAFNIRVLETLEYSEDESKTDYSEDLAALRDLCRDNFVKWEYI